MSAPLAPASKPVNVVQATQERLSVPVQFEHFGRPFSALFLMGEETPERHTGAVQLKLPAGQTPVYLEYSWRHGVERPTLTLGKGPVMRATVAYLQTLQHEVDPHKDWASAAIPLIQKAKEAFTESLLQDNSGTTTKEELEGLAKSIAGQNPELQKLLKGGLKLFYTAINGHTGKPEIRRASIVKPETIPEEQRRILFYYVDFLNTNLDQFLLGKKGQAVVQTTTRLSYPAYLAESEKYITMADLEACGVSSVETAYQIASKTLHDKGQPPLPWDKAIDRLAGHRSAYGFPITKEFLEKLSARKQEVTRRRLLRQSHVEDVASL